MIDEAISDPVAEPDDPELEAGVPVTYKTTTQQYRASASFDTQVLLNPSSDVIYPGSVLLGHTIDDGSYQEVQQGIKKSVTVSYSLTGTTAAGGGPGRVSGQIVPSLSSFRELHNSIMGQVIPPQSTTYSYESTQVDDATEFDLKFRAGATYTSPAISVSVKAGFDFSRTNVKHKYMIRFIQTFYTVDMDQGQGTFLYEDYDLADFKGYRPVYVSSIAYGRLAYLTIESSESWTDIATNLNVVFDSASVHADAELDAAIAFFNSRTTTNITVSGTSTVATTVPAFVDMLESGGFSVNNPGTIVAYKLRFVDDNAIANTVFNGDYTVRQTTRVVGGGVDVSMQVIGLYSSCDDGDSDAEYFGDVYYYSPSVTKTLWRHSEDNTCNVAVDGYTALPGYAAQLINFSDLNKTFTVSVAGFHEDDTFNDDYSSPVQTYTISDVTSGTTFTIRTTYNDDSNEYVDFYITPTIAIKY